MPVRLDRADQPAPRRRRRPLFGLSGEPIARATENRPGALDAAARLAVPDTPVPYSPALKEELDPGVEDIVAAVRDLVG